ncbi:MAG: hypothetical protein ACI4DN_12050 [Lachnospiraceae bacterium]
MKRRIMLAALYGLLILGLAACGKNTGADTEVKSSLPMETMVDETAGEEAEGLIVELTYDVPEGFILDEENSGNGALLYHSEKENEYSNLNSFSMENDGSFERVTNENFTAQLEEQMEAMWETELTLTLLEQKEYEIDGRRAFMHSYEYEEDGIKYTQTQCIIEDGEQLHFITFTIINDEPYADAFAATLDSVRFE